MSDPAGDKVAPRGARVRRISCLTLLAILAFAGVALAIAWLSRERIADNLIADALAESGVEARYVVESIGTRHQVLRDISVGDPQHPDLTIERAIVTIKPRLGFPRVEEIRLVRPRLFATFHDGKLSFGALDLLISGDEKKPAGLPDLNLVVDDGRGRIESDFGAAGVSLSGGGNLSGGFVGELAAIAPQLGSDGCDARRATLYGEVSVRAGRPAFAGPLRLDTFTCENQGIRATQANIDLTIEADETLKAVEGKAALHLGGASAAGVRLAGADGNGSFTWRDGGLTALYEVEGRDIAAATHARLSQVMLDGTLRARRNFEHIALDASVKGNGLRLGDDIDRALTSAAKATRDTLLAPVLLQVRQRLATELPGSRFEADIVVRHDADGRSLVVPGANLRGRSGETLLAVSRFQLAQQTGEKTRYGGNFSTGGKGMPHVLGRIDQPEASGARLQFSMAPFVTAERTSAEARLAIPELELVQQRDGHITFAGSLRASGGLPGGQVDALLLPLSGGWSPAAGLALWDSCTQVRFNSLSYANLSLDRRLLTLCPPKGRSILRYDDRGLSIAAGTPSLKLTGRLGETPIALDTGAIGFAWPGTLTAQQVEVALGPPEMASHFAIQNLDAQIGANIEGRFSDTDVLLSALPLDIRQASGAWSYENGQLTLSEGTFKVSDRAEARRFEPAIARDASLVLVDNVITATALMREPVSDRQIGEVMLQHDLENGRGHADLAVSGLLFDEQLQPTALTPLVLGVVANVEGRVTGGGRIEWNETSVSSNGRFSSEGLDLAAAFGPVQGASGTVVFTDLLGLTTAPNQVIRVGAINPGIEVYDGEVRFGLRGGELLEINGATWPFLGGTLTMRPIALRLGAEEVRRYVFDIDGLETALFIERIQIDNLSASGTLDGTIPIVFDRSGNGSLVEGVLVSRPPGGNLSYVGELTYEDLSPIANYAFEALQSLDYRQMHIQMDGLLIGEIITRVRFDGIRQGDAAARNFVTRRLERLPLRFDINIRAPFQSLIGSMRSLYDTSALRDPREIGLITTLKSTTTPENTLGNEPPAEAATSIVQPPESEHTP